MFDSSYAAYFALAFLLAITPGADTMLVLRNTMRAGRSAGLLTSAGVVAGGGVHALAAITGVSLILSQAAHAYEIFKFAGSAYMIWLGGSHLWKMLRNKDTEPEEHEEVRKGPWFLQGFLSNVLNPKVAIFYLAVLPQFIRAEDPFVARAILLAATHKVMGGLWLTLVAFTASGLKVWLKQRKVRRTVNSAADLTLIAFGVGLAASKRA